MVISYDIDNKISMFSKLNGGPKRWRDLLIFFFSCCPEEQIVVQTEKEHQANKRISGQNIACVNISSNETTEHDRCEFGNWEYVELRAGKYEVKNHMETMAVNYTVHALQNGTLQEGYKEIQLQVDSNHYCVG